MWYIVQLKSLIMEFLHFIKYANEPSSLFCVSSGYSVILPTKLVIKAINQITKQPQAIWITFHYSHHCAKHFIEVLLQFGPLVRDADVCQRVCVCGREFLFYFCISILQLFKLKD